MKLSKIKKVISGTVSALMIASSIPYAASAADQQTRGNIGGYDYEMWNQNGQGQASMNPSAGSFTCSWSNIENFLARMGKNFDSQKKTYKQIGDIVLTYDVEYTPKGNSYMCVYGWTRNPLMEYYIVEGWGDWRPPGNDGENKGSVTLNGNKYDIRKSMRYNQPSLDGTATFPQYWSVRQTSGSQNNTTNYMKGTIDVSKHFDAWSQAGLDMSGTLYEVSLNIEGYRSNGSANVKSVTVVTDGSGAGAGSTSDAGGNAGGGNVGGGFDMGGGNGGFDMGGFDMSQFGGGNGGGFDMSQFGGGNGGGFDMSQFGGGQGGGFDMSQFGGGNGGGFDMSQFGGGQGGGFDMSQFGGGNGGGGMDWSGFAGGFNGGGANIGSDAGSGGNAKSGLNAQIKGDMPTTVPSGVEKSSQCKVEKKTYMCKYTGKQKTCNVILPPNYDPSKKYPVMFILHGIMGSENDMVSGMGVQELMTGLMTSGKAEEFIAVTPNMFTSKTMSGPSGINQQTCAEYDNFLYDVTESLLPFIKENYSVAEGRENTAITGFSMGGREAIYCGIMRPDVFGYVGGACPAPGITPGTDSFMSHPGCMQESEFKFRNVGPEPEVFMITGGTNDSVVGTFPSQYSSILTKNGVEHVYQSIPGGGHGAESVKPHLYTFFRYAFKANEGGSTGGNTVTTTTTTTAKPTTTTTTTTAKQVDVKEELNAKVSKWGDANGDGTIDMADAVAIMQALANPNKYKLSDQGKYNADVYQAGDGVTSNDAAAIQKYLLGLIKTLPESYSSSVNTVKTTATSKTTTTTTTTKATTTTTVAVNNGGQQGGFDMSQFGGQGGFDMSQFGGQGGFDMSQFGGQQGGFDMSQFGGQQGGFDMSQFGGQQGGFDMSQFGGQQGGFDMSQFGGQQDAGQQTGGNGGAQVQSGKKLCAISFDDGASATSKSDPGYRIIDALIKNNMTATFFIVGDWIKTNDQIKYEYQNGMEVANHTQSHPHLGSMGASQIRSEWENCNSKLKGIIGAEPSHLMRLPYLESNATVQSALNDVPLISCAIDTQDWNNASKDQIVNTIKQAAQNGSLEGAIVLCHENYATTAAAMEEVLPWLAQNGYQNVNISDMAKAHGKTLAGGQVHTRA